MPKRTRPDTNQVLRKHLSEIGTTGGRAGTGAAKRRGDPEYYRQLVLCRWGSRRPHKSTSYDPDRQTPIPMTCDACGHAWIAGTLPMDLQVFARAMRHAPNCPRCGAGSDVLRIGSPQDLTTPGEPPR
jgi:hypothetical protein